MMHKIEVDDEIMDFLKKHAEPFQDTPNSVLRRLLMGSSSISKTVGIPTVTDELIIRDNSVPAALQHILEVLHLILKIGYTRSEATKRVAQRRNLAPQTIIDGYCRQLNKKAYEIDSMLASNLPELRKILISKFPRHASRIASVFDKN